MTLHTGFSIRPTGASRDDVQKMLSNVDANKNGRIEQSELEGLAKQGRDKGFADASAESLFRAGLDTAALAQQKDGEKGQQFTPDYFDKSMGPVLQKSYGADGKVAQGLVAPQASRELTAASVDRIADHTDFDPMQRGQLAQALGPRERLQDTNGNKRVDAEDRKFVPNGNGGYDYLPIGQEKADQINGNAGLNRTALAFDRAHPKFPDDGSDLAKRDNAAKWMGGKSHAEGGDWKMEKFQDGGSWYPAYKLDTSKKSGSQALDDILKNPEQSCMDCAMAKQVAQLQRLREQLGDKDFDKLAAKEGMTIGYGAAENKGGLLAKVIQPAAGVDASSAAKDYRAGQQGYANVTVKGASAAEADSLAKMGWSGEHFTVRTDDAGQKKVFAHPFASQPAAGFEDTLRERVVAQGPKLPDGSPKWKKEDVIITYDPPVEFNTEKARNLAR